MQEVFGIQPATWDKQITAYFVTILAELFTYQIKETEEFREAESSTSLNNPMKKQGPSNQIHKALLTLVKKRIAGVDISVTPIKVECFSKRFIGKKYKYPLTLSLLSIPLKSIIGVRASFFEMDSLTEINVFMPVSLLDSYLPTPQKYIENYQKMFRSIAFDVSYNHLIVSEGFRFSARKSREDKLNILSFDTNKLIPFELILSWLDSIKRSMKGLVGGLGSQSRKGSIFKN